MNDYNNKGFEGLTLFIGLGGTGYKVLMSIRKKLFRETGRLNFPEIQYCYIDSDNEDMIKQYIIDGEDINLPEVDFVEITSGGRGSMPKYIAGNPSVKEFCENGGKDYVNYIGNSFPTKGAGQIRMVGKLYFTQQYEPIRKKINSKLKLLKNIDLAREAISAGKGEKGEVNVFVYGSLAGGTGSGTAIDMPFILEKAQVPGPKMNIWGYFADYSFFEGKAHTNSVKANTFGALSEIDFWANRSNKQFFPFSFRDQPDLRYDKIYIMQNVTDKGVISFDEMIEATSDASVALVHGNTLSTMSNDDQMRFTMEGKNRILSSFGVSSLLIKRRSIIYDYYLAKHLAKQIEYFRQIVNSSNVTNKVNTFINSNNLNEGVGDEAMSLNQLIEKLCPLDNGSGKLGRIKFKTVQPGKDVDKIILTLKDDYLTELERNITEIIRQNDDIEHIIENLKIKKAELLNHKGGINFAKEFFRNLSSQILAMKQGLETEILKHEKRIDDINKKINAIKTELPTQKTFFGNIDKSAQQVSIANYKKYVSALSTGNNKTSLAKERIELRRKKAAVYYYSKLIDEIYSLYRIEDNSHYGSIYKLEKTFRGIYDAISLSIQQKEKMAIRGDIASSNHVIIDNRVIKELKNIIEEEELTQDNLIDIISIEDDVETNNSIIAIKENLLNKLEEKFKENFSGEDTGTLPYALFNPKQYPLERLILKFLNKADINSIFSTVNINNQFLWQVEHVDTMPCDTGQSMSMAKTLVVFYYKHELIEKFKSTKEFLFKSPENASYLSDFSISNDPKFYNNDDPDKIVFLMQQDASPVFKLYNAVDMLRDFKSKDESEYFYFFTDDRIYSLNYTFFPSKGDLKRWWTIANILNMIRYTTRGYEIESRDARGGKGVLPLVSSNSGKKDRVQAYNGFINKESYTNEVQERFNREMTESKEKVKEKFKTYILNIYNDEIIGKKRSSLSTGEETLVNEELANAIYIAEVDFRIPRKDLISDINELTESRIQNYIDIQNRL